MRVTLLGHASVLVELDGATCLMDPVLADPFEEGTVVSCPQRTIDAGRLPPIDILVVSHVIPTTSTSHRSPAWTAVPTRTAPPTL